MTIGRLRQLIVTRSESVKRFFRQFPATLLVVAGCVLIGAFCLFLGANLHRAEKTNYELIKDIIIPLLGPVVAICIPTVLCYLIPLGQNQQKTTLDLFNIYNTEDMRIARNEGWKHFVTDRQLLAPSERDRLLDDFLRYLTEPDVNRMIPAEKHALYQKTSRVLDFFGVLDHCLERNTVAREMIQSFFGYYYLWWRDEIMIPLRERPLMLHGEPRYLPAWWKELKYLDELCVRTR
jgi:hypothetical protein